MQQAGAPGAQTIRVQSPAMVKSGGTVVQNAQGKQIIVHKPGTAVAGSQPQIVTLVKTTQGMQVAQVLIITISVEFVATMLTSL